MPLFLILNIPGKFTVIDPKKKIRAKPSDSLARHLSITQ